MKQPTAKCCFLRCFHLLSQTRKAASFENKCWFCIQLTHFLSRRSIRGRRTVSASIAALLPLADPFIWTSSWFICFTQSSMTGLKLSKSKEAMCHWSCNLPWRMIYFWREAPEESTITLKRCQGHKYHFLLEMFSNSLGSGGWTKVLQSSTTMPQPHKNSLTRLTIMLTWSQRLRWVHLAQCWVYSAAPSADHWPPHPAVTGRKSSYHIIITLHKPTD